MITPRVPVHLSHSPTPSISAFAFLASLEAGVRGILLSVMPLAIYREVGDAALVSRLYFMVGIVSLIAGLLVPWGTRFVPRRWMMTFGASLYVAGAGLALAGGPTGLQLALMSNAVATITLWVCLNAYLLDYFVRSDIGRAESRRMFYSATMWTIGPVAGVWLLDVWYPAPFLVAGTFALGIIGAFWRLRLGDGKQIRKARGPAANPLAYLNRFMMQPRLIAGWTFAVVRSCGWWVIVVYLPIYCIESGLGDRLGGTVLSVINALLFSAPLILRWVQRASVRYAVRLGFAVACVMLLFASVAPLPWMAVAAVFAAGAALILLDVAGSLPFLMAVKPSERTEMAAVYSTFRDVSGFVTPGVAWLVLLAAPVTGVFAVCGLAMGATWALASRVHPRLGAIRQSAA
ncbi:MFS transporter [Silicimonas sp. MF1-12-2]|uniref:MFS transporter n=1 Tax=Silicimonas sp. MF1-12-2 TaxID=3384793 RepID=UPI0039B3F157